MTQPEQLIVEMYPPADDVTVTDISSRITDLSFGTIAPGGDGDCTFVMNDAGDHDDVWIRAGAKIIIRDGTQVLYCGRVEEVGGDYVTNFARLPVVVRGYASHAEDDIYRHVQFWQQGTSVGRIFEQSCAELCPDIDTGSVGPSSSLGRTLPENSQDFVLQSARHIWDTVAPLGGDGIPLLWRVFVDSTGNIPRLHLEARPTAAALFTGMAGGTIAIPGVGAVTQPGGTQVSMSANLRQIFNRVAVKITNEENACCYSVLERNASGEQGVDGIGVARAMGIDLTSLGELDSADAAQAAEMMLAQTSSLQNTGRQITLDYPQYVLDAAGDPVPLWWIRAGQIIQVVDYDSGDPSRLNRDFYIVGTRWDERRRRQTLNVGSVRGVPEAIAKSIRTKRPARSDTLKVDPVPEPGREPKRGYVYDAWPNRGGTNYDTPYAPIDHRHGTPNGDVALTYGLDNGNSAITTPANTAMGLIRGTILSWKVRCNPGGLISYRLIFPEGTVEVRYLTTTPIEEIDIPGGTVNIIDASDGSFGDINLECASNSEVRVEVIGVPTATWAALILNGTRNLIFSEPLTPVERGVGADGVIPP